MADLHSRTPPVLHRDLKSQNILLDDRLTAKVGDFGLSKVLRDSNTTTTVTGTLYWMAPEVIRGESYGTASDVYSFGIVLWQLLAEQASPFPGQDAMKMNSQVLKGARPDIPSIEEEAKLLADGPLLQASVSEQFPRFVRLVQRCWDNDPQNRPSFIECLETLESISQKQQQINPLS